MSDAEEEQVTNLSNPDVVTKYNTAGKIANDSLAFVVSKSVAGASILEICTAGDAFITDATGKIYKGKKVEKGIGFPTCISVNNVVGHFSPADDKKTEEGLALELKEGDVCKVDLGVHVDGYVAVLAHTFVVGEKEPQVAKGKAGDLIAAVYTASELAHRMLKAGNTNTAITEMIAKVADDFKVNAVHGVLSHEMSQFEIDGDKTIINKADVDEKVEEVEFAPAEVYAMDIVMTTGSGKPKEVDRSSTTVFKRNANETYQLKMKASRATLSDISKRFPTFPFTLRALDGKTARFGVNECLSHNLVSAYPVLVEKEGELVAHAKFTALLMPNGTIKCAGPLITPAAFETELGLTDNDLKNLIKTSVGAKKKKKNKKKKKAAADA